jgi:thiamine biosynthesis lipoprotein
VTARRAAPATGGRTAGHIVRTAIIMGLPFSIHLRRDPGGDAGPDTSAIDDAVDAVWRSLRTSDAVFSTYRADSDISRINRGELSVAAADPSVQEVLELAGLAQRITDGAFDVRAAGVLDPSGIVKAWAACRADTALARLGMDYYLGAGGDVLLRSRSPQRPWRIGIEHPQQPAGLLTVVQAATGAVATSGRSHRGGHIHDPRTGRPATGVTQASVVGPSLLWADILATALVARGMAGGTAALDRGQWPPGNEVLLVTDRGELFGTPGLREHLAPDLPHVDYALLR